MKDHNPDKTLPHAARQPGPTETQRFQPVTLERDALVLERLRVGDVVRDKSGGLELTIGTIDLQAEPRGFVGVDGYGNKFFITEDHIRNYRYRSADEIP